MLRQFARGEILGAKLYPAHREENSVACWSRGQFSAEKVKRRLVALVEIASPRASRSLAGHCQEAYPIAQSI